MRKTKGLKGLAVSQIILLVLGILVLAVVAYLLYQQFFSGKTEFNAQNCNAEAIRICSICTLSGTRSACAYDTTQTVTDANGNQIEQPTSMSQCVPQYVKPGTGGAGTINCDSVTGPTNNNGGTSSSSSSNTPSENAPTVTAS